MNREQFLTQTCNILRAETDQKAQAISQRESREEAFIKAVHSPLLSPRLENPAEDNDANSESTKATSAEKYGRKLEREGLQLDLDDPSSLRCASKRNRAPNVLGKHSYKL